MQTVTLLIVIFEKQKLERIRWPEHTAPQTPNPRLLSNSLAKSAVYFRRVEDIPEYIDIPTRR
jgi:hypothetical protein